MLLPDLRQEVRGNNRLYWLLGVGLGTGGAAVAQAYCLAVIIDGVFIGGQETAGLTPWLSALALLILLRAVLVWTAERLGFRLAAEVRDRLRQRVLKKIFAGGPVAMGDEQTGDIAHTLGEGIDSLEPYFARYLPQVVAAVLVPLLVLLTVVAQDRLSAIILLITAPLMPIFMNLIGSWAKGLSERRWDVLSRLSAHFYDVLQGLTTLKLFGRSREQTAIVYRASEEFRKATLEVLRVAFLSALVLELLATVSTAIVAVTVGLKLLYGGIGFREAFFILVLAPEFYLPFRLLGSHFHASLTARAATEKIARLLLDRTAVSTPVPEAEPFEAPEGIGIAFEEVTVCYPGRANPALSRVSFRLRPGEQSALVGPSGAGKSTVANLLLGFLSPGAGVIEVNGRDLAGIRRSEWLGKVAYIPQFPHIFAGTVGENIRLGAPGGEDRMVAAAEAAGIHEFVETLPRGYRAPVGEGGMALSGGEAQRIALARAFFRNSPVLILDEATAWLDPRAEDRVKESLQRLMQGKTVLIIAHRLSTIAKADQVIVLESGRVVEQGRPQDLLAREGVYRRMMAAYRGIR